MRLVPYMAAVLILFSMSAVALERSPESRGVKGAAVDAGERDRDDSRGEKRDGDRHGRSSEWDRRNGGDGRR
jgi:hypothetical protein